MKGDIEYERHCPIEATDRERVGTRAIRRQLRRESDRLQAKAIFWGTIGLEGIRRLRPREGKEAEGGG